jgi:nitroreductase
VRESDLSKLQGFKDVIAKDLITGSRSKEITSWSQKQGYIAFGNLMTTAAIMHIDACPLEGIEPSKYDALLGLENSEYKTAAACALGYRHSEDKYASLKKVRFESADVFDYRK